MLRHARSIQLLLAAAALAAPGAAAASADHIPGQAVVRYEAGVAADAREAARSEVGAAVRQRLELPRAQVVELPPGLSVTDGVEILDRSPGVAYAEPNYRRELALIPDDLAFWGQWNLHSTSQPHLFTPAAFDADIDAPEAWDITTGSPDVTIGIADTGIDAQNPDLAPNVVPGWDFADGDADTSDRNGHGTAVAGAAGAVGDDGLGVAGVSWHSKLMPFKVASDRGTVSSAATASAFAYAADAGVEVLNASFGALRSPSQAEFDALARARDTLFVTVSGTLGGDGINLDIPRVDWYPCEYDLPNILCVTASTSGDLIPTDDQNWGPNAVDLAVPGVWILAIDTYQSLGVISDEWYGHSFVTGTSIAAPQAAGAAALVFASRPGAGPLEVRDALMAGVDRHPQFAGLVASNGRLNASHALGSYAEVEVDTELIEPPRKTRDRTPTFEFISPTRQPATFQCMIDNRGFVPCRPGRRLRRLSYGKHTLSVRAIDALGIADPTPAVHKFTVKKPRR